jgi:carotenoid cleavage dioxygenase-like enzyme
MERTRRELLRDGARLGATALVGGAYLGTAPPMATAAGATAPYALGLQSLTDEVRLPHLEVDGRMPRWLRGVLVRNGPALFEIGEQRLNHWFDGLAMLHAFAFGDGRVSYANRFLRSSAYEAWRREGKMKYSEFGTDPCRAIFSGVSSLPVLGAVPNANVSIERLGARFRALTELPVPVRIDPRTARTLGVEGAMGTGRMGTAHPQHDPATGERFSYEIELVGPPAGVRVVVERGGRRRELAFVAQDRPGYLHSFGLTSRYVVLFTQPFTFDLAKFLSPGRGPIVTNFGWDGSRPSQVVLVDRVRGGVAATIELDPFFVFHVINAYDDARGRVVLDVCAHRDSGIVDALYLKNLRRAGTKVPQAAARRLTIDPATRRVAVRDLADGNFELPRVDTDRVGAREYRYAYGVAVADPARSGFVDRLGKLDVRRERITRWGERGAYPGEPVFVRRPGARGEDDGVLLSVVLDASARTSYLLVLDARDLTEIARARVPHHIPFGFHGVHASAS